ncbi:MAG TPA: sensor domain-containing diguanylate cyclase [Gemmatimonadaceae bacterium]
MTTQTSAHNVIVVGQSWSTTVSTLALLGAVAVAALAIRGSLPPAVRRHKKPLAAASMIAASLLAVLTGGASTALVTVGIAAWGMAECFGLAIGVASFALAGVSAALALEKKGPLAFTLGGATLAVAVGALPYFYARRLAAIHARRERRVTRLEAQIARPTPSRPMPTAALKRDVLLSVERTEATRDLATVEGLLRDIRDLVQADEAIFWRWSEERDALLPQAWSTEESSLPQFFRVREWGPLASWAAQERIVTSEGSDEAPLFVTAPVISTLEGGDVTLHGVLSVSSNIGLAQSREALKEWLPRFAAQLAAYLELIDMRTASSRHSRRNQALIDAMQRLQVHKSAEALGSAVCEAALEVTSGRSALLIRWLPQDAYGLVQYASRELALETGMIIGKDTLVGRTCRDGLPLLLHDARAVTRSEPAYTATLAYRPIPSLVVVPIVWEQRVIGAIVVEGAEPGSLGVEEARNVGLLAAVARAFLEKVWEIEEVSQRARTDSLTGLRNRRDFDEQLRRVLAETDRFGGSSSLILVDIDDFKNVNDTYGHEAGDAVLRQLGKILGDGVRAIDICARYGGEEMIMLLPQTPIAGATELAERLRTAIAERPVVFEGTAIRITASFGIAGYPETVPHGDWLFPAADRALYVAKHAGKNCVRSLLSSDGIPKKYQSGLQ